MTITKNAGHAFQGASAPSNTAIHYVETKYGFEWGAAKLERGFSDSKKRWVTLLLETPKHKDGKELQIYVTKSGKVRISNSHGEWAPPPKTCKIK